LRGHRGAAVVLDPSNGDILAMASAPAYDLNRMSGRISPDYFAWMQRAQVQMNRAANGTYPPGSVFKIITAITALESGAAQRNTWFYCDGSYNGIHCWQHSGHGSLNFTGALAHSCNVYFMKLAERAGAQKLEKVSRRFGLGESSDIAGLATTASGRLPDLQGLSARELAARPLGDTLQMGIGQTTVTITPLQAARIIAAIANRGKLVQPRLVRRVGGKEYPAKLPTPLNLKAATLNIIAGGLRQVVETGTAKSLDPTLRIAGKTGTAQNPHGEDHAWFVGYAPADHPRVAVAILIENGGHGGAIAAPIAESVIRAALTTPTAPPAASR